MGNQWNRHFSFPYLQSNIFNEYTCILYCYSVL